MEKKVYDVNTVFKQFTDNLKIVKDFEVVDNIIKGKIEVTCQVKENIIFDVEINLNYPLKTGKTESITFYNNYLKKFAHINYDGSVCFHTLTTPHLKLKLESDIKALLEWTDKYYINEVDDNHFEYLFYENQEINHVFLFCDTDSKPKENDFGFFYFTQKNNKSLKNTYLVQCLKSQKEKLNIVFSWNKHYSEFKNSFKGLYFISDRAPVYYRNFSFNSWIDFESTFNITFLKFLNDSVKNIDKKDLIDGKYFILLFGYPIGKGKINFETIKIDYYDIPVFKGKILNRKITWFKTVDSSYELFFGRGKLHKSLSDGKILLIGVGAIGSNLSESLVRGGCKVLDFIDNDNKEIGNICRAKYNFSQGETKKIDELSQILFEISPFVNITKFDYSIIPLLSDDLKLRYSNFLNSYDYVINCTANNDVNLILDDLNITTNMITISISNNANELVCIIGNENIYEENSKIYNTIKQDLDDLFFPQGCWNPTFRASFHNISALLNYALSNINYRLEKALPLKTFMLEVKEEENYIIKLKD